MHRLAVFNRTVSTRPAAFMPVKARGAYLPRLCRLCIRSYLDSTSASLRTSSMSRDSTGWSIASAGIARFRFRSVPAVETADIGGGVWSMGCFIGVPPDSTCGNVRAVTVRGSSVVRADLGCKGDCNHLKNRDILLHKIHNSLILKDSIFQFGNCVRTADRSANSRACGRWVPARTHPRIRGEESGSKGIIDRDGAGRLLQPVATGMSPMTTDAPIYFRSLELENVRCFGKRQLLEFTDRNGNPVRWVLILGDNGVGKTTLLQCLAWMRPVPHVNAETGRLDGFEPALDSEENEIWDSLIRIGDDVDVVLKATLCAGRSLAAAGNPIRIRGEEAGILTTSVAMKGKNGLLQERTDAQPDANPDAALSSPSSYSDLAIFAYGATRRPGTLKRDGEESFGSAGIPLPGVGGTLRRRGYPAEARSSLEGRRRAGSGHFATSEANPRDRSSRDRGRRKNSDTASAGIRFPERAQRRAV